jgi:ABC-type polysaccharide/polyol phosphate transport system ATPase subunit
MYSIEIKDVSKKFRIYHDRSLTLKERLLFFNRTNFEERQVLKDISLNIEKGKTVGLIGQNGSGKSTLLKLLTGIIYPDSGEIKMSGRVSSLLELGAGFHPDFSGRENIYTNASIFGLTRSEIDRRFNQIVEFSELQAYIDNPVRTYSSGMYMRLAFSVAINVDADILLIDEILAVGDAGFQKKCMDKIKELKKKGTTIVLVTHDMGSVERICDNAVWLEAGAVKKSGNSYEVVNSYLEFMGQKQMEEAQPQAEQAESACTEGQEEPASANGIIHKERWGSKDVVINNLKMLDEKGNARSSFKCGEKVTICFEYEKRSKKVDKPVFGVGIFRNDGVNCYGTNTQLDKIKDIKLKNKGEIKYIISALNLLEGHYCIDVAVVSEDGFPYDYIRGIMEFDVFSEIKDIGTIRLNHQWVADNKVLS